MGLATKCDQMTTTRIGSLHWMCHPWKNKLESRNRYSESQKLSAEKRDSELWVFCALKREHQWLRGGPTLLWLENSALFVPEHTVSPFFGKHRFYGQGPRVYGVLLFGRAALGVCFTCLIWRGHTSTLDHDRSHIFWCKSESFGESSSFILPVR